MRITIGLSALLLCSYAMSVRAQSDSIPSRIPAKAQSFEIGISKQVSNNNSELTEKSLSCLRKLTSLEAKLKSKLSAIDPAANQTLLNFPIEKDFAKFGSDLKGVTGTHDLNSGLYLPYLDSSAIGIKLLSNNSSALANGSHVLARYQNELKSIQQLQGRLQISENIQAAISARKEQILRYLDQFKKLPGCLSHIYANYSKTVYYYKGQLAAVKSSLNNPDEAVKKSIGYLYQIPAAKKFIGKFGVLGQSFSPANPTDSSSIKQGLQSRRQIQQMFTNRFGDKGNNAFSKLQEKVSAAANQSAGAQAFPQFKFPPEFGSKFDDPNFQGNDQKTKSFAKRIQYGLNLQTSKSALFFPVTADLAVTVGYKLNKSDVIGVGLSYKAGLGTGINHMRFSSQGVGIRSFVDMKMKASFFLSGGFEYNYQKPYSSIQTFKAFNPEDWTKSGLIGVSQIVPTKGSFAKSTKMQVLWDFLSYSQFPRTSPIKFRVGFGL